MNVLDVVLRALGALLGLSIAAWFVLVSVDLGGGFARFERRIARAGRRGARTPGEERHV